MLICKQIIYRLSGSNKGHYIQQIILYAKHILENFEPQAHAHTNPEAPNLSQQ